MKRFHIHVGVSDLNESVQFYSTLFGQKPSKLKENYAKWQLDDPRVNFAISTQSTKKGIDHLGIQAEEPEELLEITTRLKNADLRLYDEGETTCCYAQSDKAWIQDPNGIAWEAYQTMADVEVYRQESKDQNQASCCVPKLNSSAQCC